MSQQQRQIRREAAQFREDPELRRRRPIGLEGPLPSPGGPTVTENEWLWWMNADLTVSAPRRDGTYDLAFGVPLPGAFGRVPVSRSYEVRRLKISCSLNASLVATVVTVLKNGVATALTFTIPAGISGSFAFDTPGVFVADGDVLSFDVDATGLGAGQQLLCNGSVDLVRQ